VKIVLVGVTGAVASVGLPMYISTIKKILEAKVIVMLSKNASRFITPYSLSLCSGNETYTDTYDLKGDTLVPHIKHTDEANIMLIMPATANIIAKAAHGICDDIISTSIIAASCPVVFVPSMNNRMWQSNALQANLKRIKELGYHYVEPENGIEIEGGKESYGGMASSETVISLLKKFFNNETEYV
jgi:phosphopantothenoylcysteine decarboxylase/phosphopantothenate--cysteine ligase